MRFNKVALAACAAAGLAVSVNASAQEWHGRGHGGFGGLLSGLQLSTAQKQQIGQIMSSARTQNAPTFAKLQALHQQVQATLLSSSDVTEAQLLPLEQQEETLRQQLAVSRLQTQIAVRNVLTGAQLAQAASTQAKLASLHLQERALTEPAQ